MLMVMCKNLADLLEAEQPLFSVMVEQLERASGRPSVDVRLLAEIIGKVHMKIRALGLDPHDTTGPELYHALQDLIGKHDLFIAKKLDAKNPSHVSEVLPKIGPFIDSLAIPKSAWVLKHSVAKRLLKQTPPKQVMAHLHYRSIDSMLKREPVSEIFGSLRFAESPTWQQKFMSKYAALTPMDFEVRDIDVIHLDSKKWAGVADTFVKANHYNITHLKELGVVLILPLPVDNLPGISLTTLAKVLHNINDIRLYSAYFKLQQTSHQFGVKLRSTLQNDSEYIEVAGHKVHWRAVHGHFAKNGFVKHLEAFEPHLQLDDLEWRRVEEVLYRIEPALHFWHDMDFVAAYRAPDVVSFNLMDNALSFVNKLHYDARVTSHFNNSLLNELMIRYVGQPPMESLVIKRLSGYTVNEHVGFIT